jgi:hypothetical protein
MNLSNVDDDAKERFQIRFHKVLLPLIMLINPFRYAFLNPQEGL